MAEETEVVVEQAGGENTEFTPITSQEQLNEIIGKRLKSERQKRTDLEAKLTDYEQRLTGFETATKEAESLRKTIAEQETQIAGFKVGQLKARIAHEMGIPYDAISRLNGTTEEEIRADAEELGKLIGKPSGGYPERSQENTAKSAEKSAIDARYKGNPWYKGN